MLLFLVPAGNITAGRSAKYSAPCASRIGHAYTKARHAARAPHFHVFLHHFISVLRALRLIALALLLLILSIETYPIQSVDSIGLWYVITLTIIILGTFHAALMALLGTRVKMLQPFADWRKEACFDYCRRLMVAPVSEAAEIMAQLREKGKLDLATRLYLSKRLEMERRKETSWGVQLKAMISSLTKGDVDEDAKANLDLLKSVIGIADEQAVA